MVDLAPEGLEVSIGDREIPNINRIYSQCYQAVFPDVNPDSLSKHKRADIRLRDQARDAGCSVELFIMALMIAHKSATDRRFYSSALFSQGAVRAVRETREAAISKYGFDDAAAIGEIYGVDDALSQLDRQMDSSEEMVCQWVIGFKRRMPGKPHGIYARRELGLSPTWLALEPSYAIWLNGPDVPTSAALEAHRDRVKVARAWLKGHKDVARKLCQIRSRRFILTVEKVLSREGFTLKDFMSPSPVTDAMRFLGRLGLALQQVDCLNAIGFFDA